MHNSNVPVRISPVILCGGSGTRLWPMSRKSYPKQFLPLINDQSLLLQTLKRVSTLNSSVLMLGSEEHRFLISDELQSMDLDVNLILEPYSRNTAAAMGLAALFKISQTAVKTGQHNELLLFCPADHHIPNHQLFKDVVEQGAKAALQGHVVTFGIQPTHPNTGYGYIQFNPHSCAPALDVLRFVEKPALKDAQSFLLSNDHLWNSGIFLVRLDILVQSLEKHAPDIFQTCAASMANASIEQWRDGHLRFIRPNAEIFATCRNQSIDYAVMEHLKDIKTIPFHGQWSDVGSWSSVADLSSPDQHGNKILGDGLALDTTHTYINAPFRKVVALGVKNLLIIDTPDAVLIANQDSAQSVKEVVETLEKEKDEKTLLHRKVKRPWGWYDRIDQGERFQVKRISVNPGASLSLQKHHHRAEHWIVVKGTAEVTCGEHTFLLSENQSTYIPVGEIHRLHNPTQTALEMIEVQSGSYLGEDDIVRLDDSYGRG